MQRELVGMAEGSIPVEALESLGDRRVEKSRAGLSQLGVDHLLQQRMREVVIDRVDAAGLRQHSLREQLVDGTDDLRLREAGYSRQRVVIGARTDDGREIGERARMW